jgi:ABC-2 type transport system permease protein
VLAAAVLAIGLVSTALTALASAPILGTQGVGLGPDAALWLPVLGGSVYLVLVAALGFGIGALLRNSAGGIATVLGLLLVVPTVVSVAAAVIRAQWVQDVAALLPSAAGAQLFKYANPGGTGLGLADGLVLNGWGGFAALLAWVLVFLVPALVLVRRRDV